MAERLPLRETLGLTPGDYATLTLHRPSNVDDPEVLQGILDALADIAGRLPILFPIHPRTRKMIQQFGFEAYFRTGERIEGPGIWLTDPLGYLEFLHLNMTARLVLTDSGGLQEETTVLGVPCITMRHNTERPITCEEGTNVIVGNQKDKILAAAQTILNREGRAGRIPEKWDGHAAERIVEILVAREG